MATIYSEQQVAQMGRLDKLRDNEGILSGLMLFPAIVYIVALIGFPFVIALIYSVSDVTAGDLSIDFVGFDNFSTIMDDPVFWESFWNTIKFTVMAQTLVIILANTLALALNRDFRGKWIVRFLILLPWATPISLGTIGWLWILDSTFSPIDWTLVQLGLIAARPGHLYYLGKSNLAVASVVMIHVWRILPLATVIIMAGLTSIPKDIKDAVAIDGVGFWREYFEVTLPLLRPILAVASLIGIIFIFTDMTVVFLLTRGGPISATQVLSSWAYFKGIDGGNLAQGAASALFLFAVLLTAVILLLRTARRSEVA